MDRLLMMKQTLARNAQVNAQFATPTNIAWHAMKAIISTIINALETPAFALKMDTMQSAENANCAPCHVKPVISPRQTA